MTNQEALWLTGFALGLTTSQLMAKDSFTHDEEARIDAVLSRRENGEPLQYIMGEADFWGRDFRVGPGVLIPRHDTETVIQAVMKIFPRDEALTFVDWGTGSGCIAATLLMEFPRSFAFMVENSPQASHYAEENLRRYGLTGRAKLVDDAEGIPPCPLLVSNPPYIPSGEINGLMREVRDFEPHSALDGGPDGKECYREVFALAGRLGCEWLVLEGGEIPHDENFLLCDTVKDDGGFARAQTFRRRSGR